ncbi:MAG TPA: DoxX family protein [Sphingomicrobium sp.]|nr:DoxX family protein [Sphingomicrobium sp.]
MDRATAARFLFALTFIALGVIGLVSGTFAPGWQPVPETAPARELLFYLSVTASLACGAGLLARRTAAAAALALLVVLLVWTALFKFPFIVRAPLEEVSYQTNGENFVLIAASWALYARAARAPAFPAGEAGLRIAYLLYGLALIAFGLSHFFYLEMTAPLVPAWLPGPVFWAYSTGVIYLGAGILIATGLAIRPGALAAAAQITLITLLVWGPMLLAGPVSGMQWQETMVSFALAAGALVLASAPLPVRASNRDHFPRRRSAASDSRR